MASPGKKSFVLRVDPDLRAEVERLAEHELRSANAQAEFANLVFCAALLQVRPQVETRAADRQELEMAATSNSRPLSTAAIRSGTS